MSLKVLILDENLCWNFLLFHPLNLVVFRASLQVYCEKHPKLFWAFDGIHSVVFLVFFLFLTVSLSPLGLVSMVIVFEVFPTFTFGPTSIRFIMCHKVGLGAKFRLGPGLQDLLCF